MAYLSIRWFLITLAVLTPVLLSLRLGHDRSFAASFHDGASMLYPDSVDLKEFEDASLRWSAADSPTYIMIVRVATEVEVQRTILYANRKRTPFLAISGGHGQTSTVGKVKNGIGIHLGRMSSMYIDTDGQSVVIQGGVRNGALISYLWAHGKQTMTTGCDCVGYIAPILGGGHGWLQGRYGLAADQLISARLVLANGTAIEVSQVRNPDLFWAIRGAGHNFGIVTSARLKIYDVEPSQKQWAASSFVFTHDKLESLFAMANNILDSPNRPVGMVHYLVFAFNPDVDPNHPIIVVWIYYQAASIPFQYTRPLYALSPVAVESSTTDLAGVNAHLYATDDGVACAKGFSRKLAPVSLQRYDIGSIRKAFDVFAGVPSSFHNSVMFAEGYATNRVEEIDANSTAFPDRAGKLLLSPILTYLPNASLDAIAEDISNRIRDALLEGSSSKLVSYVNYARGDESMEAIYGYEPWRLEKLRRLKKEYDPFGRFNYYAPIS
ncbi:FAD-binding domain-containing protein [Macroventuria anomochaeta]|uniref:FAD-binding domain-containing protein n=1 Tax=Macroventuria anomochaeta TaxID=301207 RepID=A0ACB6RS67_9PLEO|nr:FAD-binding domain-containing protein [Macroventuria anomochaeta]KAF2624542.1 FAD-binding domain-containing protein [Macroventuria anomochaeta]